MDDVMKLLQSNLLEHKEKHICLLKTNWKGASLRELTPIPCLRLNPYKMVEMWKNYHPVIPVEYQSDALYVKPSPEVLVNLKVEKTD